MSAKLLTMSPSAARAHAQRWFLAGFQLSGYQFHGERVDVARHAASRRLLLAEFARVYDVKETA